MDGDDEFRFNDMSNHEGSLHQNGILTWFSVGRAIMVDGDKAVLIWSCTNRDGT